MAYIILHRVLSELSELSRTCSLFWVNIYITCFDISGSCALSISLLTITYSTEVSNLVQINNGKEALRARMTRPNVEARDVNVEFMFCLAKDQR